MVSIYFKCFRFKKNRKDLDHTHIEYDDLRSHIMCASNLGIRKTFWKKLLLLFYFFRLDFIY